MGMEESKNFEEDPTLIHAIKLASKIIIACEEKTSFIAYGENDTITTGERCIYTFQCRERMTNC